MNPDIGINVHVWESDDISVRKVATFIGESDVYVITISNNVKFYIHSVDAYNSLIRKLNERA